MVKLCRDVFVKHDAPMIVNIRIHHECEGEIEIHPEGEIHPEDHRLASRGLLSDDK